MFFILNNEKAVLAADKAFLESVGVPSIFLLAELFRSDGFHLDEERGEYEVGGITRTFTRTPLQTTFGNGYFYWIDEEGDAQTLHPASAATTMDLENAAPDVAEEAGSLSKGIAAAGATAAAATAAAALNLSDAETTSPLPADEPAQETQSLDDEIAALLDLEESPTPQSTQPQMQQDAFAQPSTDDGDDELAALLDLDETPAPDQSEPAQPELSTAPKSDDLGDELMDLLDLEETAAPKAPAQTQAPQAAAETAKGDDDELIGLLDLDDTPAPAQPAPAQPKPTPAPKSDDLGDELMDLLDLEETSAPHTPAQPQAPQAAAETAKGDDDELIGLLDLDDTPAPAAAPQPKPTPAPKSDDLGDELMDLLDLDAPSDPKPQSTPAAKDDNDVTDIAAAIAGIGAGAAMLKEKVAASGGDDEILGLLDEDATPKEPATLPLSDAAASVESDAPFTDYQKNADLIGITKEEYLSFLQQFTDEALGYEPALKKQDLDFFKQNLVSIKDASQLLHLPRLSETIGQLEHASATEYPLLVEKFFGIIRHIRRDIGTQPEETLSVTPASTATPAAATPPAPEPEPTLSVEAPAAGDLGDISGVTLESVEAIPFDFSTRAASDELGLPESLVQEFVADFVNQAKENIPVLQDAYKSSDIDTIQKTAHLLKGAASNLRIDPLAETLKTLQYNEELAKVPSIFSQFVGQLKALIHFTDLAEMNK